MKSLVSIFLILIITSPLSLKVGVLVNWKMNQKYIAAKLCVNRNRPKMHCDGKCQLSKMLDKLDQEKRKADEYPLSKVEHFTIDPFQINTDPNSQFNNLIVDYIDNEINSFIFCYSFQLSRSCFHPPENLA